MTTATEPGTEALAGVPSRDLFGALSEADRRQIDEVLRRRANEIASFRRDLEEKVSKETGKPIRLYDLPGSVELALTREMNRLRRLADKVKVPEPDEDEED